jgi:integrase
MPQRKPSRRVGDGTFAAVIAAYFASDKFQRLAHETRRNYTYLLGLAQKPEILGALPVDQVRPSLVQGFLDGLADRPGTQSNARAALKAVEKWAIVRDHIPHPITLGTEVVGSEGGHKPWTDEQIVVAIEKAPHMARVIILAANTGQRSSDLIRMRWTDLEVYEGRQGINVTQLKTGKQLWVPMTAELQQAMEGWEKRPGFILLKPDGQPWNRNTLSVAWHRARERIPELAGLTLHGLRSTAVVRLRRAGATLPQITDLVGMSEPMVRRYCRFAVQKDNAMAAVVRLDAARPSRLKETA